jgi:hypothetical protein
MLGQFASAAGQLPCVQLDEPNVPLNNSVPFVFVAPPP